MPFTGSPVDSVERALSRTSDKVSVASNTDLKIHEYNYVHAAGAGIGEINLLVLPAGKIKVYNLLSRVVSSSMVTGADLHIGTRAHTQEDGTDVAQDQDTFALNINAGAAMNIALPLPVGGVMNLDSQEGVEVYCEIDVANIEDGDTISGWICYAHA